MLIKIIAIWYVYLVVYVYTILWKLHKIVYKKFLDFSLCKIYELMFSKIVECLFIDLHSLFHILFSIFFYFLTRFILKFSYHSKIFIYCFFAISEKSFNFVDFEEFVVFTHKIKLIQKIRDILSLKIKNFIDSRKKHWNSEFEFFFKF